MSDPAHEAIQPGSQAFGSSHTVESGLTRPPGGFSPFASRYSMMQAVAVRNAMDDQTVIARWSLVGSGADLRRDGDWNHARLALDVGLSEAEIFAAGVKMWLPSVQLPGGAAESLDELLSRNVRNCVECAEGGFHSTLHQLVMVHTCPVHRVPLAECCPVCGAIRRYGIRALLHPPYGCPCSSKHFSFANAAAHRAAWSDVESAMADYLTWVATARATIAVTPWADLHERAAHTGVKCIVASLGNTFEQFLTSSASEAIRLPPVIAEVVASMPTVVAESCEVEGKFKVSVRGQRATAPQIDWKAGLSPCVFDSQVQLAARDSLTAWVLQVRRVLRLSTIQNHAACIEIEAAADQVLGGRRNTICCGAAWLLRQTDMLISSEDYVRSVLADFHIELAAEVASTLRTGIPIAMVAAELTAYKILDRIAVQAMALVQAHREGIPTSQALHDARFNQRPLAFTVKVALERQQPSADPKRILQVTVLQRHNWQHAWATLCFTEDHHIQKVRAQFKALQEAGDALREGLERIREPRK